MLLGLLVIHSFLFLSSISLYGYTIVCLSTLLFMGTWIVSIWGFLLKRLIWVFLQKYVFRHGISFHWGVELLGYWIGTCFKARVCNLTKNHVLSHWTTLSLTYPSIRRSSLNSGPFISMLWKPRQVTSVLSALLPSMRMRNTKFKIEVT